MELLKLKVKAPNRNAANMAAEASVGQSGCHQHCQSYGSFSGRSKPELNEPERSPGTECPNQGKPSFQSQSLGHSDFQTLGSLTPQRREKGRSRVEEPSGCLLCARTLSC